MTSQSKRFVVTGMGIVGPLGCDTEKARRRLLAGRSGIRSLPAELTNGVPCTVGGQVPSLDEDPVAGFDPELAAADVALHSAIVPGQPRGGACLDNGFGFGGVNASELFFVVGDRHAKLLVAPSCPQGQTPRRCAIGMAGIFHAHKYYDDHINEKNSTQKDVP